MAFVVAAPPPRRSLLGPRSRFQVQRATGWSCARNQNNRISRSTDAFREAIGIAGGDTHAGILFCVGTFSEMTGPDGKGEDIPAAIREFGASGHIHQVHFRNTSSPLPSFHETFPDNGYVDLVAVMRALNRRRLRRDRGSGSRARGRAYRRSVYLRLHPCADSGIRRIARQNYVSSEVNRHPGRQAVTVRDSSLSTSFTWSRMSVSKRPPFPRHRHRRRVDADRSAPRRRRPAATARWSTRRGRPCGRAALRTVSSRGGSDDSRTSYRSRWCGHGSRRSGSGTASRSALRFAARRSRSCRCTLRGAVPCARRTASRGRRCAVRHP